MNPLTPQSPNISSLTSLSASSARNWVIRLPAGRLSVIFTFTLLVRKSGALRLRITVICTVAVLLRAGDPPSWASIRSCNHIRMEVRRTIVICIPLRSYKYQFFYSLSPKFHTISIHFNTGRKIKLSKNTEVFYYFESPPGIALL